MKDEYWYLWEGVKTPNSLTSVGFITYTGLSAEGSEGPTEHMKRMIVGSLALLSLGSGAFASTLCANAGLDFYIANYTGNANACTIGDKLFYNFTYSASTTGGGSAPLANESAVIPDAGDGFSNPGLIFSVGGFVVSNGRTLTADISYTIATLSGSFLIEDYSLAIAGSHTGSPLGLGSGTITESFSNAPAGTPLVATVGPLNSTSLTGHVEFLPWVNSTTVNTHIFLQSPAIGTGSPRDIVTISAIQEHFSEAVPEPYEFLLIGSGLLLFGVFRKRATPSNS
jgi:hypothetical protein